MRDRIQQRERAVLDSLDLKKIAIPKNRSEQIVADERTRTTVIEQRLADDESALRQALGQELTRHIRNAKKRMKTHPGSDMSVEVERLDEMGDKRRVEAWYIGSLAALNNTIDLEMPEPTMAYMLTNEGEVYPYASRGLGWEEMPAQAIVFDKVNPRRLPLAVLRQAVTLVPEFARPDVRK